VNLYVILILAVLFFEIHCSFSYVTLTNIQRCLHSNGAAWLNLATTNRGTR